MGDPNNNTNMYVADINLEYVAHPGNASVKVLTRPFDQRVRQIDNLVLVPQPLDGYSTLTIDGTSNGDIHFCAVNVPHEIVVNSLTINSDAHYDDGDLQVGIYSEAGNLLIVATFTITATGTYSVALTTSVILPGSTYYVVIAAADDSINTAVLSYETLFVSGFNNEVSTLVGELVKCGFFGIGTPAILPTTLDFSDAAIYEGNNDCVQCRFN